MKPCGSYSFHCAKVRFTSLKGRKGERKPHTHARAPFGQNPVPGAWRRHTEASVTAVGTFLGSPALRSEGDTDGDAMGSELGGDLHARITAWRFPEAARSSSSAPLPCCPRAPPKGTGAFGTAPRRTLRHALSGEFIGFPGSCSSSARGAAQGGPRARAAEFKSRSRAQGRG